MKKSIARLLGVLTSTAVAVSACGGSGSTEPTASEALVIATSEPAPDVTDAGDVDEREDDHDEPDSHDHDDVVEVPAGTPVPQPDIVVEPTVVAGSADEGNAGASDEPAHLGVIIDIEFVGGELRVADDRIEVDRDATVTLRVESDVAEEIHIHGYDVSADISPAEPTTITFVADTPGVFEVEFEASARYVTELLVR